MLSNPTFWVAVSFVIFMGIVVKAGAVKSITEALDARGRKIADDLAEAKRLRAEAEALLAEYEGKRKAAEREAAEIVATAKTDAERMAKDAEAKLADFIARRTKAVEVKIAQAEAQATADVKAAAADAAAAAAEQILRGAMSGKAGADAIAAGLADVRKRLN
jgi:F-type H+-transporting ATPase subunit b